MSITCSYKTEGTCSSLIEFEISDGKVKGVSFTGGCHGNTQGIAALAEGRDAREVADILEGIKCRQKPTSCPDQLSKAIRKTLANND